MKIFFDILPIIIFFIAFKFFGIFIATAIAMLSSLLQIFIIWRKKGRVDLFYLLISGLILGLGTLTLIFHNELFFKWKPTAVSWTLGAFLLLSDLLGKKNFSQRTLEAEIKLPAFVWRRVNISWALFFIIIGTLNLYVMMNYDTNTWVNFKLFGFAGLTLVFAIVQAIYISFYTHHKS